MKRLTTSGRISVPVAFLLASVVLLGVFILMLLPTYALLLFVLLMPFYNGSIATMVRG